jgi:hypothetical protein
MSPADLDIFVPKGDLRTLGKTSAGFVFGTNGARNAHNSSTRTDHRYHTITRITSTAPLSATIIVSRSLRTGRRTIRVRTIAASLRRLRAASRWRSSRTLRAFPGGLGDPMCERYRARDDARLLRDDSSFRSEVDGFCVVGLGRVGHFGGDCTGYVHGYVSWVSNDR